MELSRRKNIRLKDYDYSKNGAYFITICVKDRNNLLWRQNVGAPIGRPQEMPTLSDVGLAVDNAINNIPNYYADVTVDKYVIMPNHVHLILLLSRSDGRAMRAPTVSTIVNQMKGYVTKQVGFSMWQKLFHDRIIRNEAEYQEIWEYIDTNPLKWELDKYYRE